MITEIILEQSVRNHVDISTFFPPSTRIFIYIRVFILVYMSTADILEHLVLIHALCTMAQAQDELPNRL